MIRFLEEDNKWNWVNVVKWDGLQKQNSHICCLTRNYESIENKDDIYFSWKKEMRRISIVIKRTSHDL